MSLGRNVSPLALYLLNFTDFALAAPQVKVHDPVLSTISSTAVVPGNEGMFGANYVGSIVRSSNPALWNNDDSKHSLLNYLLLSKGY